MRTVFIDANFLLEGLLVRRLAPDVIKILNEPNTTYNISSLTVHLVYHFAWKDNVKPSEIARFIKQFTILPVDTVTVLIAQKRYDGRDFEDCLQAAAAEQAKSEEIITLDRTFAADSSTKLPVTVIC